MPEKETVSEGHAELASIVGQHLVLGGPRCGGEPRRWEAESFNTRLRIYRRYGPARLKPKDIRLPDGLPVASFSQDAVYRNLLPESGS